MSDDVEIKALLARIDERTGSTIQRLIAMEARLDTYPTQRDHAAALERIAKLEGNQARLVWAIIGNLIAGSGVALTFGKKLFG